MNPENQREIRRAKFLPFKERAFQAGCKPAELAGFLLGAALETEAADDYLMELNPQQMQAVEEFCRARGWSFDDLVSAAVHSFVEEYGR